MDKPQSAEEWVNAYIRLANLTEKLVETSGETPIRGELGGLGWYKVTYPTRESAENGLDLFQLAGMEVELDTRGAAYDLIIDENFREDADLASKIEKVYKMQLEEVVKLLSKKFSSVLTEATNNVSEFPENVVEMLTEMMGDAARILNEQQEGLGTRILTDAVSRTKGGRVP